MAWDRIYYTIVHHGAVYLWHPSPQPMHHNGAPRPSSGGRQQRIPALHHIPVPLTVHCSCTVDGGGDDTHKCVSSFGERGDLDGNIHIRVAKDPE